jgi:hypothetical protein
VGVEEEPFLSSLLKNILGSAIEKMKSIKKSSSK